MFFKAEIKKIGRFFICGLREYNFDLISAAITNAIMKLSVDKKKPIGNSILTLLDRAQAKNRHNRGREAVQAVYKVLALNN